MESPEQVAHAVSLLNKRCNRAIATVLGVKEREADRYLPEDVQDKLRKTVLDQFNELAALAQDCVKAAAEVGPGDDINDVYWDLLGKMSEIGDKTNMILEIASRED